MDTTPNSHSIFGRTLAKFRERPAFYIGSGTLAVIAGAGLYGLKARKIRLSLYLINLRLAAQGSFVAVLTGGVAYSLAQRYVNKNTENERSNVTGR